MAPPQLQHARRTADSHTLYRSVNERLRELNETFRALIPRGTWVCECFRADCAQAIELTIAEFERLRAHPGRFVVAADPAHVDLRAERVVGEHDGYWTVEIGEDAGRNAHAAD